MQTLIYNLLVAYFRFFAVRQLQKNPSATIIGITGSAGKTSTRLALVHILHSRGVVKHSVHANSEIGVPLNILGLAPRSRTLLDWLRLVILAPIQLLTYAEHFDYYVVELGIDSPDAPKNMATLLRLIRPHVGIVLNAGLTHAAAFDHLVKDHNPLRRTGKLIKFIAKEKMQLVKSLRAKQIAVVNLDQSEFASELKDVTARVLTFGQSPKADVQILPNWHFKYQGSTYELKIKDIFPDHYSYTFAAAIAAASGLGIPPSLSIPLLSSYRAPPGRLRLFPGIKGSTMIDSSYNASPRAMQESLQLLQKLGRRGKKIAVLGDMRELGESTRLAHKNLADWIMQSSDEAILLGDATLEFTYPVLKAKKFPAHHFTDMASLTAYLRQIVTPKSHVLIKGSQNGLFMERAVEALLADQRDAAQLCRRGSYWDKLRSQAP